MTKENTLNKLAIRLLKILGNNKPTQKQVNLTKKLLLTAAIEHHILFNEQLTEKEISCLLLAAKGLTSAETANLLEIKKATVETHRRKILNKLDCSSIGQAVFEGIRFGYIQPKNNKAF